MTPSLTPPTLTLCEVGDASALGVESASPFCLKIHRALQVAELPYSRRFAPRPSSHKALNRTGQVPVLLVDERAIPDSTAILRWLVEQGRIDAPAESWAWEELADTALNGFLVASRWLDEDNWPRTRQHLFGRMPAPLRWVIPGLLRRNVRASLVARDIWRAGPEACWARLDALLDVLDARAPRAGVGWMGGGWTVADFGLFGQLRSLDTSLTPRQAAMLRARPRLAAWVDAFDTATRSIRSAAA